MSGVEEGPRAISEYLEEDHVPIMIIPNPPTNCPCCCCFSCWHWKLNVPNGMMCLEQVWGANNGLMEPGCRCCYWCKYEVAAMISRNSVRFNIPIMNVPTKDNVRVHLDVGVHFHIGRKEETLEEDAVRFFYNFGPNRL